MPLLDEVVKFVFNEFGQVPSEAAAVRVRTALLALTTKETK